VNIFSSTPGIEAAKKVSVKPVITKAPNRQLGKSVSFAQPPAIGIIILIV
jgi:hypothetical protein